MLTLINKYLLLHKKVVIPFVGAISIRENPASLDITDNAIFPPHLRTTYEPEGQPDQAQVDFFAAEMGTDKADALHSLEKFGRKMVNSIQKKPYKWALGIFQWKDDRIEFDEIIIPTFHAVRAKKVIREDARHDVRVGETTVSSSFQVQERSAQTGVAISRRSSFYEIIGWIVAILALVFIAWYFYENGFTVNGTGNLQKVTGK